MILLIYIFSNRITINYVTPNCQLTNSAPLTTPYYGTRIQRFANHPTTTLFTS